MPYPIVLFPWVLPHDPNHELIVETPQGPPNVGDHHPSLRDKNQDCLQYGQVGLPLRPRVFHIPPQGPREPLPDLPILLEVVENCWPVVVHPC